jgi:hypothetical protein
MKRGLASKGFLLVLVLVFITFLNFNFVSAFSLQEIVESPWANAALLFLLIFNFVLYVTRDVFKGSQGSAVIVAIVLSLGGSLGVVAAYGSFLARIGVWLLIIFIVAIALLISRFAKGKGIVAFVILGAGALLWLIYLKHKLCQPNGNLADNVCQILDALSIIILIACFLRLLWAGLKKNKLLEGKDGKDGEKDELEKPDKSEEQGKSDKNKIKVYVRVIGDGRVIIRRGIFNMAGVGGVMQSLKVWNRYFNRKSRLFLKAKENKQKFIKWVIRTNNSSPLHLPANKNPLSFRLSLPRFNVAKYIFIIAVFGGIAKPEKQKEEREKEKKEERLALPSPQKRLLALPPPQKRLALPSPERWKEQRIKDVEGLLKQLSDKKRQVSKRYNKYILVEIAKKAKRMSGGWSSDAKRLKQRRDNELTLIEGKINQRRRELFNLKNSQH